MDLLRVSTLGGLKILQGDVPLARFESHKAEALLVYLACNRRVHPREVLADLLWEERSQEQALANLRVVLTSLRKRLDPYLLITRETVALNPEADIWIDVAEFEKGLNVLRRTREVVSGSDAQQIEGAIDLYSRDFLEGFYVRESRGFDEWMVRERERLHSLAVEAMQGLISYCLLSGDYPAGITHATRLLGLDPLDELAHQQMMQLLAYSGKRSQAIAQYETCRQILRDELGIEPSAATQALHEKIRSGELVRTRPPLRAIRGYQLEEQIGAGSFGAVYRAYQPAVGREVAVKVILPQYANDLGFIRRFETEAQLVARLEHPHIVPLYDYWREPDGAYLVMRWLKGGSLAEEIQRAALPMARAAAVVEQIASALSAAHHQGVIHRDLKPANILLDEAGNAYLSDFGIAKVLGEDGRQTQGGALIGSPVYMSPEQVRAEPITTQSDIYSLGIMTYEILTGELPFLEESLAALIEQKLHAPLPSVKVKRPELPARIDEVIQRAAALDPNMRYTDVLSFATDFSQALLGMPVPTSVPVETERELLNPYKGLRAFQEADVDDFFGREALTERLLARLGEKGEGARFLAVVGPSGSGKSSLVKAGLIPALRRGALPGSEKWLILEMIPGNHPFEELEVSLLRIATNPAMNLMEQLQRDERGILRAVRLALPSQESELLLVIDQFEEVFALVEDVAEARKFLESLSVAVTEARSPLRVVITLRADFFDRPLLDEDLSVLLQVRTEVVVPLTEQELEQAIRSPAERVGIEIEPGLVTAMVAEVREQPGALPLLQYALTGLFERRTDRRLTLESYHAIGGVEGVLEQRAEETFAGLSEAGKVAARQILLRQVTLGEGVEDTRRRVLRNELEAMTFDTRSPSFGTTSPGGENSNSIAEAIEAFGRVRLLSFDRDPSTRNPTVEIAHEALLREWGRLRGWLDEGRADVRMQRALGNAADDWIISNHDPSFLLHGIRLDQYAGWAMGTSVALTQVERMYLETSIAERDRLKAEELERQQRELVTARKLAETEKARAAEHARDARRLRWLVAGLAIFFLAALGLSWLAFNQRNIAQDNFVKAERVRLASQAQIALDNGEEGDLPALLALHSLQYGYSIEADAALLNALSRGFTRQHYLGHTDVINDLDLSPDGRTMVTCSQDGTVRLWDVQTGQELRRFSPPVRIVNAVEFSPDGRYVAVGSPGPSWRLWDVQTDQEVRQFVVNTAGAWEIKFSPDGKYALTGDDGTVHLWEVATGRQIRQYPGQEKASYPAVAFSPDGRFIAIGGSDKLVRLLDVATGQEFQKFNHDTDVVFVAFSSDGQDLLTVSGKIAHLWEIKTGLEIRRFVGHTGGIIWAEFSSDGRYLVTSSSDKTARLWEVATGQELHQFIGHTGGVNPVAFSPDGRFVLTGSADRTARLWDVQLGSEPRKVSTLGVESGALSMAFPGVLSPDGQYVLTLQGVEERGKAVAIWNTQTGDKRYVRLETSDPHPPAESTNILQNITAFAFSPDNRYLVGGDADGNILLWDAQTGKPLSLVTGHSGQVRALALLPDDRTLLSGGNDQLAWLWNIQPKAGINYQWGFHGEGLHNFLGHSGPVLAVAYSPDSRLILTGSEDQTARLWDARTGRELHQLRGHSGPVRAVAFSPDGKFVLTGSDDNTARLWDAETGQEVREFLGHTAQVTQVAFSPDGSSILTGSADRTARLWDLQTGRQHRQFVGHLAGVSYAGFLSDSRYVIAGDTLSAIIWRIKLDDVIAITCAQLARDLTPKERALYNIADVTPTCAQFTSQRAEIKPTQTAEGMTP